MRKSLDVFLSGSRVGRLVANEEGRVSFRTLDEYRQMAGRPVLSQSFEDDLTKIYRGRRSELPSFFSNLIPEGLLRELIEKSLQISSGHDLALLEAVGGDLPGAVEIRPGADDPGVYDETEAEETPHALTPDAPVDDNLLRFSLAGVQLKFSVLREGDKLTLPAHNQQGHWIVKIDSSRFPLLVDNELAILEWARAAGFSVPECHLAPAESLSPVLRGYAIPETNVLVIRRYDRDGERRIHQEDFAQVTGLPPRLKYDQITYEQLAGLALAITGPEGYFEFIRRLAFVIASGNTDAHLKNWSLIYPDGIHADLSPLYDQVCTIAWPEVKSTLALSLVGSRWLAQANEKSFERLAAKAGADAGRTLAVLRESLDQIAVAWREAAIADRMPPDHAAALVRYRSSSSFLRHYG